MNTVAKKRDESKGQATAASSFSVGAVWNAFGDNYGCTEQRAIAIPINALYSGAQELLVAARSVDDDDQALAMTLIYISRRLEIAAGIGMTEVNALLKRVDELEAQLAATKPEAAE